MRYIATKTGIRDNRRVRPGQEFEGPEGLAGSWFEPVGEPRQEKEEAHEAEPRTLSEAGALIAADVGTVDLA